MDILSRVAKITTKRVAPEILASWNPPLSGRLDLCIKSNGEWFHEGDALKRQSLKELFASILRREKDNYFLVTPVEKWQIDVEHTAFQIISYDYCANDWLLNFKTDVGDSIQVSAEHPLVVSDYMGQKIWTVEVRQRLFAAVNRNVYYQLAEHLESKLVDGEPHYGINSAGVWFALDE